MKQSPFIVEDAVPPEKFFNRSRELEFLRRMLDSGKRKMLICIVAPLKYGKTSLLLKYNEMLRKYSDIVPIYVNLKEVANPLRFIIERFEEILDVDLSKIYLKASDSGDPLQIFIEINKVLVSLNKWLFLLFDEFHLLPSRIRAEGFLKSFDDKDIFTFFRGYAEMRRISYIVCGSVIEPLLDAVNVWGGRFEIIYLGPFEKNDALFMLKKLFDEGGVSVSPNFLEDIVESAGYHPFYIQYLGSVLYSLGEVNKRNLIEAKKKLMDFLRPIFDEYILRISDLGKDYLKVLIKIAKGEEISFSEKILAIKLFRKGFLVRKNMSFDLIDPLFKRYLLAFEFTNEPPDVLIVGHWAERIVGNYLIKKGYIPYYSHDSKGAFDIYVRIKGIDVGIQVKYSASGSVYLTKEEADRILKTAEEMGWIPVLALVSKRIDFFYNVREGVYKEGEGLKDIELVIK